MQGRVVDIFAGIGGFSCGFKENGFDIVLAVEKDPVAFGIYQMNFPTVPVIHEELSKIDIDKFPDFDVLISRVPLKSFSYAGRIMKDKESPIEAVGNIIEKKVPKCFFLDTSKLINKYDSLKNVIEKCRKLGYSVHEYMLEIGAITGKPIIEERLYIVGLLNELSNMEFKFSQSSKQYPVNYFLEHDLSVQRRSTNIRNMNHIKVIDPESDKIKYNYINIPFINENNELRRITAHELAKMKGFPQEYILKSNNSWKLYRMVTQVTNVDMAKLLARQLRTKFYDCGNNEKVADKEKSNKKDLTNSRLDRQNILNNKFAIKEIRESANIRGILYEGKIYFTKSMVADFFEIDIRTVERYVSANLSELEENGYKLLKGSDLKGFIEVVKNSEFSDSIGAKYKITQMAVFDFKAFLNLAMLLSESENARILRQAILSIVIDLVNKKTGGSTKYINQRDKDFISSYLQGENYRREFTDALRDYVDMDTFKYALFTDMIYQSIFKEKAKEYREILRLNKNDSTRETFYSEILDLVSSYECGLAQLIMDEGKKKQRKLSNWEVKKIFKDFEELPHWKPLINRAREKMASRDLALRDAFHKQLETYIKPLESEEYDKFLGKDSEQVAQLMEENRVLLQRLMEDNKDVLQRLKERE